MLSKKGLMNYALVLFLVLALTLTLTSSHVVAQQGLPPNQIGPSPVAESSGASGPEQNLRSTPLMDMGEAGPVIDNTINPDNWEATLLAPAQEDLLPEPGLNLNMDQGIAQPPFVSTVDSQPYVAGAATLVIPTCTSYGEDNYENATTNPTVVRSCALSVPVNGKVFIMATGTVDGTYGVYDAIFNISVDKPYGDDNYDRYVSVVNDATYGDSDRAISVSALIPVGPGNHTIYFVGRRYSGTATVNMYDPTLSAVFIPSFTPSVKNCWSAGQQNYDTTSATLSAARQCSITLPEASQVFVIFNTGLYTSSASPAEAHLRIGIDNLTGDGSNDRWAEVSPTLGRMTTAQVSGFYNLSAGTHSFYGLVSRWGGSGTVRLFDSSLAVIVVPSSGQYVLYGSARGEQSYRTTSASPVAFRTISAYLRSPGGYTLMIGDGGMDNYNGYYEAEFEPMVSGSASNGMRTGWGTMYPGDGSGLDATFAMSRLDTMGSGASADYTLETFRFLGTGEVLLYDTSLSILYFPYNYVTYTTPNRVMLPTVRR